MKESCLCPRNCLLLKNSLFGGFLHWHFAGIPIKQRNLKTSSSFYLKVIFSKFLRETMKSWGIQNPMKSKLNYALSLQFWTFFSTCYNANWKYFIQCQIRFHPQHIATVWEKTRVAILFFSYVPETWYVMEINTKLCECD